MTAAAVQQSVAAFALHAVWQVPLLAVAAFCAVRIGRPTVRLAHGLWVATLTLCVALPLCSTLVAQAAARAEHDAAALVLLNPTDYTGSLPALHREAGWLRLLHRHVNRQDGLQPFAFTLDARVARVVTWLYALSAIFFASQLVWAWLRLRAMVRAASAAGVASALQAALYRQCLQLRLALPRVRVTPGVSGPALAGVLRPVLLLPPGMFANAAQEEIEAVLAHELAHLRRHDPLLHALCSLLVLPVSFHPAALWVSRCVRQTREMACDAEAAGQVGSHRAYARALLQVAERMGPRTASHRLLGLFSNGLFGAGFELFNRSGTMEERMEKLVEVSQSEAFVGRAVRVTCGVLAASLALAAAGMVQVRPALAAEQAMAQGSASPSPAVEQPADPGTVPHLLSGEHARQQLHKAQRELARADRESMTSKDRQVIATSQDMLRAAEGALASAQERDAQARQADALADLEVRLRDLPQMQAMMAKQHESMAKLQARFNSPEWKAEIAQQEQLARRSVERMRSPEFKAEIEAASKVDQAHIDAMVRDAVQQQQRAMEQLRSGAIQRQIEQANQMLARNHYPAILSQGDAEAPVKVSGSVMSANATHKEPPVYPAEAKQKKIQGAVLLQALISEQGTVEQLSIIDSPDPLLSKSALDAVKQWTYRPYLLNGKPTAVETTVTVTYTLAP